MGAYGRELIYLHKVSYLATCSPAEEPILLALTRVDEQEAYQAPENSLVYTLLKQARITAKRAILK